MPLDAVILVRSREEIPESKLDGARKWLVDAFEEDTFHERILLLSDEQNFGPTPITTDGSLWYDVGYGSPMYGVGYERGDWDEIKAIVRGLEERLPGVEIWYGNDCSDESLRPFEEWLPELDAWFERHGNEPYFQKLRARRES